MLSLATTLPNFEEPLCNNEVNPVQRGDGPLGEEKGYPDPQQGSMLLVMLVTLIGTHPEEGALIVAEEIEAKSEEEGEITI